MHQRKPLLELKYLLGFVGHLSNEVPHTVIDSIPHCILKIYDASLYLCYEQDVATQQEISAATTKRRHKYNRSGSYTSIQSGYNFIHIVMSRHVCVCLCGFKNTYDKLCNH